MVFTAHVLTAQDLNIDLQALASSLSSLPVWEVLDIDAALCKMDQPKTKQQSASVSMENALSHAPAEGDAVQPDAAAAAHARSTMTMHTDRSAESTCVMAASPTTSFASPAPAAESVANTQSQPVAHTRSQQTLAGNHTVSLQSGGDALESKSDSDDLDVLLNGSSLSKPQVTSKISKPAPQQQDSLEDWLNSL